MASVWEVLDDARRLKWELVPFATVGPLRFGMWHEHVQAALANVFPRAETRREPYGVVACTFSPAGTHWGGAVTTYYDDLGLAGVAIHARLGPQVTLDGVSFVGRVPSELEDQFAEYVGAHGQRLGYGPQGDPGSDHLGVVLRAERANDMVLSRPVFVARRWAELCADAGEGRIPASEWATFLS